MAEQPTDWINHDGQGCPRGGVIAEPDSCHDFECYSKAGTFRAECTGYDSWHIYSVGFHGDKNFVDWTNSRDDAVRLARMHANMGLPDEFDSFGRRTPRKRGWRADCPRCVASKFTCDEHYSAGGAQGEPFPHPRRRDGKEPCGECRLPAGETCDICGASA